ncbi:MAG: LuxR C-terminal-related transcriptional regulator [Thermomicrobiales bacterium]
MNALIASSPLSHVDPAPSRSGHRPYTTKIIAPRLRPDLVFRTRLIDAISYADAPLTVICGPAGYGKSTLVTQWMVTSGTPTAWAQLDAHDNDPWDFFQLIASAIESIDPEVTSSTRELLEESPPDGSSHEILGSLMESLSATTRQFALVLDDYQVINSPAIHDVMRDLLLHLPPTMRVFVVSRTEPPFQLARLRGRHQVLELGQDALRFTGDEALELLQKTNGLEVTPGDVDSLNDHAEGWVAGLQLVAYMLHAQSKEGIRQFVAEFCGSVRSIENYLWEEVIGRQSTAIQDFLLRTSILERFTAPLCAAITGIEDSDAAIRHLERSSLFITPLDHLGHWYRYHHLFTDVLRDRLAQVLSGEELNELHRRAAIWLEEHEFFEQAARHAIAGRDWDRAAGLLEQICGDLYEQDRTATLCTWLQGVPLAILELHPKLAFWLAYAFSRMGRFQLAAQPLRIAEQAWVRGGDRAQIGELRIVQALRSTAQNPADAIDYAKEARELLADDKSGDLAVAGLVLARAYLHAGDVAEAERTYAIVRSTVDSEQRGWIQFAEMTGSADVLTQQGKLLEAAVLHRRVIKLTDERHAIQGQRAHGALGWVCVEWNMLDDGVRHLRYADALAERTKSMTTQPLVCLALARAYWAWGDVEAAFDEVERAVEFATQMGCMQAARDARARQARFWLAQGRVALAHRWADSNDLDPYLPPAYDRNSEYLTYARLLIADELPNLALTILDATDELAAAQGRTADRLEISLLRALAQKCMGDHTGTIVAFHQALAIGEPGGFVRAFADEGSSVVPLLRHATTRGAFRDYAQRLLTAIEGAPEAALAAQGDTIEALSDREVEVLRLVAAGLPNRDIGHHLFITEKTVKKHLSNILGKLQSTNRTQAVDQARRIGWL